MNASVFRQPGGELQDAVMESSYWAQTHVQAANEVALINTVGQSDPMMPNSIFAQNNVRNAFLSDAEIKKAEEMCSPEYQPQLWEEWRDADQRLAGWRRHLPGNLRRSSHDLGRYTA